MELKRWIALHILALGAGAAIGLASWQWQFSGYVAMKIMAIDRLDLPSGKSDTIMDPAFLVETIKSAGFARKVADRAGDAQLAGLVASASQGGLQHLKVRTMQGNGALELRYYAPTAAEAAAAMDAISAEIAAEQQQKTDAVIAVLSRFAQPLKLAAADPETSRGNKTSMESALARVITQNRSGLALETTVLPPGRPFFLMLLGACGLLMASLLLHFKARFGLASAETP
jgi:hypothetical protein